MRKLLFLLAMLPTLLLAQTTDSWVRFAVQYDYWAPQESAFTFVSNTNGDTILYHQPTSNWEYLDTIVDCNSGPYIITLTEDMDVLSIRRNYRENDKCPPWTVQSSKMRHNKKNKTIYYDNAVIKVYDLPIFYLPKLSHPDPSVDRRSGFLPPSFSDSRNLGAGLEIPYFWNLDKDKDFTLKSRLFESEHPLFSGEYRQAFKESDLIINLGFTEGYKNTSNTKKSGNKSHFFSQFVKKFKGENDT